MWFSKVKFLLRNFPRWLKLLLADRNLYSNPEKRNRELMCCWKSSFMNATHKRIIHAKLRCKSDTDVKVTHKIYCRKTKVLIFLKFNNNPRLMVLSHLLCFTCGKVRCKSTIRRELFPLKSHCCHCIVPCRRVSQVIEGC